MKNNRSVICSSFREAGDRQNSGMQISPGFQRVGLLCWNLNYWHLLFQVPLPGAWYIFMERTAGATYTYSIPTLGRPTSEVTGKADHSAWPAWAQDANEWEINAKGLCSYANACPLLGEARVYRVWARSAVPGSFLQPYISPS